MLRKGCELMNGLEHVDELVDASTKKVEAPKDQRLAEVKLLTLGKLLQGLLGDLVLLLVGHV
eukprot:CAMPEP_0203995496 /NCGR_PEP_ID=MMETSP0360-20130528/12110_1 /ASSEMBLY_ACC=CAM_ASM_000342 /TAXON_ID=268821 /ORGANISM="Scrippsiella Hangoei, Strain SHTV-5" /LENGTH=61 /DNA_ID=CAMNT_0050936201 /DNA_START=24 /DNA_END=209 /DNA_ORIENTATION=-